MRCKICGYRARTFVGMTKHYRKKHPEAMKRRKKQIPEAHISASGHGTLHYCPYCGAELNPCWRKR